MLVGAILFWIVTFVYWMPILPLVVLFGRLDRGEHLYRLVRVWGQIMLRLLGIQLVVDYGSWGTNPFDDRAARVMVANHPSALEVPWGASICPRGPMAIGKKELIYIPVLNLVWFAMGFALVDRKNTVRAIQQLSAVSCRIVSEKLTLMILPEGTRSPDGKVGPFKKGAFHIAVEAQVQILPIAVHGTYELMPREAWLARPGVIRIKFLPAIETRGKTSEDIPALAEQARSAIVAAVEEIKRKA